MKHLFVPYEIAKILEEKGFDEKCIAHHVFEQPNNKYVFQVGCYFYREVKPNYTLAPLHQQVVDWFRKKGIIIQSVSYHYNFNWQIKDKLNDTIYHSYNNEDYYFGYNKAIEEALKLI